MIDIHCHILPGMDDGPESNLQFLEMAREAVKSGVTSVLATPHHLNGRYENSKEKILEQVKKSNEYLKQKDIPLTVYPGQEIRMHRELFNAIKNDEILTINNMGKYLLIEFRSIEVPTYSNEMIYELSLKGITSIIVHPERNKVFNETPQLLFELVEEGALVQLTAGSIVGHFGRKVKAFSEQIIEHHLAHFIATDAHNVSSRGFYLQEAYNSVANKYGLSQTYYYMENAELLLLGKSIQIEEPTRIRKRVFWVF